MMIAVFILKHSLSKAATVFVTCRADGRDANTYRIYFLYKFCMAVSKFHKDSDSPFSAVSEIGSTCLGFGREPSQQPGFREKLEIFMLSLYICPKSYQELYARSDTLRVKQICYSRGQKMDVFYIAGIAGFCALSALLVVGCHKLRRAPGGRP